MLCFFLCLSEDDDEDSQNLVDKTNELIEKAAAEITNKDNTGESEKSKKKSKQSKIKTVVVVVVGGE
jgi:hypothetical protein